MGEGFGERGNRDRASTEPRRIGAKGTLVEVKRRFSLPQSGRKSTPKSTHFEVHFGGTFWDTFCSLFCQSYKFSNGFLTSQLANTYFYNRSCTYVLLKFASNYLKAMHFSMFFFASARKRKIVQKMLFLGWIVHVSMRNLCVLRGVPKRHARKPLFL